MEAVIDRMRRVVGSRTSDRDVLVLLVLGTILLRVPFLLVPLGIDEGGYAYVAERWLASTGNGLYGDQWVDRPPLLLAWYAVAVTLGGELPLRLMGVLAACVTVITSARVAGIAAGSGALRWTGIVAAVLTSSALLQGQTVNAELPAIACTSTAVWLTVHAVTGHRSSTFLIAILAGIAASCAVLMKQSFVDAFAFGIGCVGMIAIIGSATQRARARIIVWGGAVGVGIAASLTAAWAVVLGPGVSELLHALYGFRLEARQMLTTVPGREDVRAYLLLAIVVLTGLLALFIYVAFGLARIANGRQTIRCGIDVTIVRAVATGLLLMGCVGLTGIMLGGSWWTHYLLQLVPMLSIGTGLVIAAGPGRTRSRVARHAAIWATIAIATTGATWLAAAGMSAAGEYQRRPRIVGDWLAQAAATDDTALVTWGHANVLQRSGMRSPYSMSWSLPMRVRDPRLQQLRVLLGGPNAPTWVVHWNPLNSWGIDADGRLRELVEVRYEQVATICDVPILRRRDEPAMRQLPATPDDATCAPGPLDPDRIIELLRQRTATSPTASA